MPGEFHEAQQGYYPIHKLTVLREDATEAPVDKVAVTKTGHKNALSREDATEVVVEGGVVPKTGRRPVRRTLSHAIT